LTTFVFLMRFLSTLHKIKALVVCHAHTVVPLAYNITQGIGFMLGDEIKNIAYFTIKNGKKQEIPVGAQI
ncbi:MAG: hypothetical protein RR131_01630, partial [Anaerovorax sp.]